MNGVTKHLAGALLLLAACCAPLLTGCAYRWGGEHAGTQGAGPLLVQPPVVENLAGVPGLDERFVEAFLEVAAEYPEIKVAAGTSGLPLMVVVKKATADILVRDDLDRVVEARRHLVAEVCVGDRPRVAVDTAQLSAGEGLDRRRRPGSAAKAESEAVFALARAVVDVVISGGKY